LDEKKILALIGPNGAGKTTVFNILTGIYRPTQGSIKLNGEEMVGKKPYQCSLAGMARTFQNIRLFGNVSVIENLMIAQSSRRRFSLIDSITRNKSFFAQEREMAGEALRLLEMFHLKDKSEFVAKNLPYGEQRKLEIARALMTHPKVLLLDEPCAGMVQTEIDDVIELIAEVRKQFDVAILLIEHHMSFVMSIADRIKVIDFGETIADGLPSEIQCNSDVIAAYLGGGFINAQGQ
jgi:branched-chain amino acid transport system ATP-binding protein